MKASPLWLAVLAASLIACRPATPPPHVTPQGDAASENLPGAQPRQQGPADLPGGSPHRARRSRPDRNSQPGQFDFYLLNLSWSPEFCLSHASSPECPRHPGLVVHGLWPQNNEGTYPESCSSAPGPQDPSSYLDVLPTVGLIGHEWSTHGTCSGLAPDAYFNDARTAFREVVVPQALRSPAQPQTIAPSALLAQLAAANPGFPRDSFALSCGNNRLTAVEACLTRDLKPESCPSVRSCGATVITIAPQ